MRPPRRGDAVSARLTAKKSAAGSFAVGDNRIVGRESQVNGVFDGTPHPLGLFAVADFPGDEAGRIDLRGRIEYRSLSILKF